jgi:hypothetical protein
MPAKYVRPYSKGQKNDYRDAEAIAEAVQRPTMKFVATKTADQLDLRALHQVLRPDLRVPARPDHTFGSKRRFEHRSITSDFSLISRRFQSRARSRIRARSGHRGSGLLTLEPTKNLTGQDIVLLLGICIPDGNPAVPVVARLNL